MAETSLEQLIAGIDRELPWLHKQRWIKKHVALREVERNATGRDRERAHKAVLDHYATEFRSEVSRGPLVESAIANFNASRQRA